MNEAQAQWIIDLLKEQIEQNKTIIEHLNSIDSHAQELSNCVNSRGEYFIRTTQG